MALVREEDDPEHDRPQHLGREAEDGYAGEVPDSREVDQRRERDDRDRDQLRLVLGRREAEQGADVRGRSERHGGDRHEQRPGVEPAREPAEPLPDELLRPLVDPTGDRILRHDFRERENDEHLARNDQRNRPDHRGACGREPEGEERVHADDRREVGEAEREVAPQAERSRQLLAVPERRELGRICSTLISLHASSFVARDHWNRPSDATTMPRRAQGASACERGRCRLRFVDGGCDRRPGSAPREVPRVRPGSRLAGRLAVPRPGARRLFGAGEHRRRGRRPVPAGVAARDARARVDRGGRAPRAAPHRARSHGMARHRRVRRIHGLDGGLRNLVRRHDHCVPERRALARLSRGRARRAPRHRSALRAAPPGRRARRRDLRMRIRAQHLPLHVPAARPG